MCLKTSGRFLVMYNYAVQPVITKEIDNTIKIGYSGKLLGNTNGRFGSEAEANYATFLERFPGKTAYDMPAVGKNTVINVDNISTEELDNMEADALITTNTAFLLVLKAADCIPLVIYKPGDNILALVHVGTTGADLHIATKVIQTLGLPTSELHCYIGPSISKESYLFTDAQHFKDKQLSPSWNKFVAYDKDGVRVDLKGYLLDELIKNGVPAEHIQDVNIDTGSDPNYFSHRRHRLTGENNGRNCFSVCLV